MTAEHEPQELGELKELLEKFMTRFTRIESEMELLKEDQKTLVEEFEDRLDTKTLRQAIRIVRAKKKIKHQDTFERYEECLDQLETL
jgi:uncharacterized protein (UPF0335 family)